MLQVSIIRDQKEKVLAGLKKRAFKDAESMLNQIIEKDSQRRETQAKLDELLSVSNKTSKEIGELFKAAKNKEAAALKAKTIELKEKTKLLTTNLKNISCELSEMLYKIPNIPNEKVPEGSNEEDNEVCFEEGTIPTLHKGAMTHWELAKKYDLIDFELGNKITGAGFPVYKGKGAKLQRALINYFLDVNTKGGYQEVQVPHLVNEASGFGTGQLPDKEGQMYHVTNDNLYLIPTAEVPITNLYRDVILKESDLPIMNTGYTPCFRREAGSYGAHVRGLNRLHQFDKVEIVRIERPENSYQALEHMLEHVKGILKELGLPYRILRLCSSDLSFTAALTYDFEVYSTAQERWLEISSVSNFETYQSNRLKMRYKNKEGKTMLAHTLNGSSLALPRVMAGLLENKQTEKGIEIPKVLVPYCGFERIE